MPRTTWAMAPYIHAVGTGPRSNRDLTFEEARAVGGLLLDQQATALQHGTFLVALRNKGESPDELRGLAGAIRERATPIAPRVQDLVDIGAPYDGRTESVVISPFASIVAAAAGAPQVMHGAPDMPPKHGVGNHEVLNALGLDVSMSPGAVEELIEREGFGYMNQEVFCPALHALKSRRGEMTLRSAFNTVEKITNLASAAHVVIGLTHSPYLQRITGALPGLGYKRSFIVQGIEGNEDVSTWRPSRLVTVEGEADEESRLDPSNYQLDAVEREDLRATDPLAESIDKFLPVLEGQGAPRMRDLVAYNAGLRIWLSGQSPSMAEAIIVARETIAGGKASEKLSALTARAKRTIATG